jgi:hypothetical protein
VGRAAGGKTARSFARRRIGWLVALALAVLARGGLALDDPGPTPPTTEQPGSPFPSREKLEDLTRQPVPEARAEIDVAVVPEWTLEGPFPNVSTAQPYREPTNWGGLLEAAAVRRAGLVVGTEALHCAAREWGRFQLAHGARPAPDLTRWMAARCGASTAGVVYHHFDGGVPAAASEDEIFEAWSPAVQALIDEHLVGGPLAAGIWYGRKDDHAIAVIATGERKVQIAPLPQVVAEGDGVFVLRGETLEEAEGLSAWVNRGAYGAEACEPARDLRLPRFAFRCSVDRTDAESWLSVTLTRPGRLLGNGVLDLVLFPSGEPSARWVRPSLGESVVVGPETDVGREIARLVNRVRAKAGVAPLELSDAQSEVARELAPYFFASAWGHGPPGTTDLVVLGLMAGWRVEGTVQSGDFASSWVARSLDLDHLVANALERPSGRRALLSPEFRKLAVGAVVDPDSKSLAGVYGTYALFEEEAHDEHARAVLEALDAARAARGKSRARLLPRIASLGRLAASRVQGDEDPSEVLSDLLRQSSRVLGRSVNGWVAETTDLSKIPFPEALLERDPVHVAVGVSHRRRDEDPWGRFVVLFVAAEPEGRGA